MMNKKILLPFLFGAFLASGCNLLDDSVAAMKNLNCSLGSKQDCEKNAIAKSEKTYDFKYRDSLTGEIYYLIQPKKYKIIPTDYSDLDLHYYFVVRVKNSLITGIGFSPTDGSYFSKLIDSYYGLFYDNDGKKITKASRDWMSYLNKNYVCKNKNSRKKDQNLANTYPADYAISRIVKNFSLLKGTMREINDNDLFESKDDLLFLEDTLDLSEILSEIQNK